MPNRLFIKEVCFRELPQFPGYRVGDDGSVWSRRDHGVIRGPWRQLKPKLDKDGYSVLALRANNCDRHCRIHVLMLMAFVGPRPNGQVGRHIDDDKSNNKLSNLAWGTLKQNSQDAVRNGCFDFRGERNGRAKLTENDVREIRKLRAAGLTQKQVAQRFGIHWMRVSEIDRKKAWAHVA
jgi:hypothetical protein